jgi:serine/threonine protein kinase, bacterial
MGFFRPASSESGFLQPGQTVVGRWNRQSYHVVRKIGEGANGEVYQVACDGRRLALKISAHATNIALEYHMLREMHRKVQGLSLGPFVVEMDDFAPEDGSHSPLFFYVMEYVEGIRVEEFLQRRGSQWAGWLVLQLLSFLAHLHERGMAFGDLKGENLLVHPQKGALRVVDFGGVTPFGKGIRQFTAWYDRAYWGKGARQADEGYDLFAAAMLLLHLCEPKLEQMTFPSADPSRRWQELMKRARRSREAAVWWPVLEHAWAGRYKNARMMHRDVGQVYQRRIGKQVMPSGRRMSTLLFEPALRPFSERWDGTDWALFASVLFALSVFVHVFVTF